MVRSEEAVVGGHGKAVWKECTTSKENKNPDGKASQGGVPPPSNSATTGRSTANNSRRKRGNAPPTADTTSSAAVSGSTAVAAVGAATFGGGATGTGGNSGASIKAGAVGATANGWLEPAAPATSTPSIGRPLLTAAMVPTSMAAMQQHVQQESAHSGEVFLMEMLAAMDQHMQQLRETQQGLVATVELACRRALGRNFTRLVLVGSVALRVETPGSDVDVVCFTRRDGPDDGYETVGLPVDVLRRVHWALTALVSQYADQGANFSMELIDDARVPILRVLWGSSIAVDVSVDQNRPVDHVRWFQKVGAAPRPTAPPPAVAPLVTLTLRCVKWWLRQRQVPRTKEGGMATIAWLLMAVHVCSLPETHEQAITSGQRPMVALLASLAAFFHYYAAIDGLDGVLQFAADGSSSEFRRGAGKKPSPRHVTNSPWGELSVLDPTREGTESLDLAPRLPPATQLLMSHELRRASQRLHRVPKGREIAFGDGRRVLEEVFEPMPEGVNALPSFFVPSMGIMGALLLCPNADDKGSMGTVELGIIESISPRPGWAAPFLHRNDERSEVSVQLLDIEERTGKAFARKTCNTQVVLSPSQFICRVQLEKDNRNWKIDNEGLDRFKAMQWYAAERTAQVRAKNAETTEHGKKAPAEPAAVSPDSFSKLPSPSRASSA